SLRRPRVICYPSVRARGGRGRDAWRRSDCAVHPTQGCAAWARIVACAMLRPAPLRIPMNSSVVLPSPAPAPRLEHPATGIDPALAALAERIGAAHLEQRLAREHENERRMQRAFDRFFHV